MSIDESIAHEREVAKEIYVEAMLCHANPNDEKLDGCIERGKYHEQLAEWLEELKELRKIKEDYAKGMQTSYAKFMYDKAIDDFVNFANTMPTVEEEDGEIRPMRLEEMAERLKAGGIE